MSGLDHPERLVFPPLLAGEEVTGRQDPAEIACLRAAQGCDAGLVTYRLGGAAVEGAIVFAPEVPLRRAMAMLPLCGVGFQNALGALAPPEVAVHLEWNGTIRVNGARCGSLKAFASTHDPEKVPDWLVIALDVPILPPSDHGGLTPEDTALFAEGCSEISAARLLEAWARHSLMWINRWESEGNAPLHAEWQGLAHGIGEPMTQGGFKGTALGLDEDFGLLLRDGAKTHLIPLTSLLETP